MYKWICGITAIFINVFAPQSSADCADRLNFRNLELKTETTKFSYQNKTYDGQKISISGPHHLNKLARTVNKDLSGLQIIINNVLLGDVGARGAYIPEENILIISEEASQELNVDPVLLHELVHASQWDRLRKGKSLFFVGLGYNRAPDFRNRQYGYGFGVDEIVASLFSANFHANTAIRSLDAKDEFESTRAKVLESLHNTGKYLNSLNTMLTTMASGLSKHKIRALPKSSEDFDYLKKISPKSNWQQLEDQSVELILKDELSELDFKSMLDFSRGALETMSKADKLGFKLQNTAHRNLTTFSADAKKYFDLVNLVFEDFRSRFPDDAQLLNGWEGSNRGAVYSFADKKSKSNR